MYSSHFLLVKHTRILAGCKSSPTHPTPHSVPQQGVRVLPARFATSHLGAELAAISGLSPLAGCLKL